MDSLSGNNSKQRERTAFLVLTVALFPILAVAIIVTYGFAVWIWQMFSGPPGS